MRVKGKVIIVFQCISVWMACSGSADSKLIVNIVPASGKLVAISSMERALKNVHLDDDHRIDSVSELGENSIIENNALTYCLNEGYDGVEDYELGDFSGKTALGDVVNPYHTLERPMLDKIQKYQRIFLINAIPIALWHAYQYPSISGYHGELNIVLAAAIAPVLKNVWDNWGMTQVPSLLKGKSENTKEYMYQSLGPLVPHRVFKVLRCHVEPRKIMAKVMKRLKEQGLPKSVRQAVWNSYEAGFPKKIPQKTCVAQDASQTQEAPLNKVVPLQTMALVELINQVYWPKNDPQDRSLRFEVK